MHKKNCRVDTQYLHVPSVFSFLTDSHKNCTTKGHSIFHVIIFPIVIDTNIGGKIQQCNIFRGHRTQIIRKCLFIIIINIIIMRNVCFYEGNNLTVDTMCAKYCVLTYSKCERQFLLRTFIVHTKTSKYLCDAILLGFV